jgi:hypothetical protein
VILAKGFSMMLEPFVLLSGIFPEMRVSGDPGLDG